MNFSEAYIMLELKLVTAFQDVKNLVFFLEICELIIYLVIYLPYKSKIQYLI